MPTDDRASTPHDDASANDAAREIDPETAALIERAVRGELSDDDRATLDARAVSDRAVGAWLALAQQEHRAMELAANEAIEHATPGAMRDAIERKLTKTKRTGRVMLLTLLAGAPVYGLGAWMLPGAGHRSAGSLAWMLALPITPLVVWGVASAIRAHGLRRSVERGDAGVVDAYTKHLSWSRNEWTVLRACWVLVMAGLLVGVPSSFAAGDTVSGALMAMALVVLGVTGWRTALSPAAQREHDATLVAETGTDRTDASSGTTSV